MATIFLSYRRTDGPQACRIYDWLSARFGGDAVFMDVTAIPIAVSFSEFIREAIVQSKVLIALIGADWHERIAEPDDLVCKEIETAFLNGIPVLPVLIGNTPMPDRDSLPDAIADIAAQNAVTVGVLHNFHTHMQSLLPKIESILGAMAVESEVTANPQIVQLACRGIVDYLIEKAGHSSNPSVLQTVDWRTIGTNDFGNMTGNHGTLFLHRITRLAELLELHFILSFWGHASDIEYVLAGWAMSELERTPVIPENHFGMYLEDSALELKLRRSDEDARQIWKMVTDRSLRLSLSYVATIAPRGVAPVGPEIKETTVI
jgi:hypothetical protein